MHRLDALTIAGEMLRHLRHLAKVREIQLLKACGGKTIHGVHIGHRIKLRRLRL